MIDYSVWRAYQSALLGDSGSRCSRCFRGPVLYTDGFMMSYCQYCESFDRSGDAIGISFPNFSDIARNLFATLKSKFQRKQRVDALTTCRTPAASCVEVGA